MLIIISLLFGGYLLFKHADSIKQRLEQMTKRNRMEAVPVEEDPDDLGGQGVSGGESRFG